MAKTPTQGLGRLKGGGSGFGLAISDAYLREGASVLLGDLTTSGAEHLAAKYPSAKLVLQRMNVTKREDWDAAVRACEDKLGGLDVLVNNASTSYKKPATMVTEAEFARCFDVNVLGIFHSVNADFSLLVRNGKDASVINTSSCGAQRRRQGLVWYNTSKGAVSNATKGPNKIRVNSICPLLTKTGLFEMFAGVPDTPENRPKFLPNVPLDRLGEMQDVAHAAVFLASDESALPS